MSAEVKATVEGNSSGFGSHYYVSGVTIVNHNSYHVEVTVRRVPGKVAYERWIVDSSDDGGWALSGELQGKGYAVGQKVRISVEPLVED